MCDWEYQFLGRTEVSTDPEGTFAGANVVQNIHKQFGKVLGEEVY